MICLAGFLAWAVYYLISSKTVKHTLGEEDDSNTPFETFSPVEPENQHSTTNSQGIQPIHHPEESGSTTPTEPSRKDD